MQQTVQTRESVKLVQDSAEVTGGVSEKLSGDLDEKRDGRA